MRRTVAILVFAVVAAGCTKHAPKAAPSPIPGVSTYADLPHTHVTVYPTYSPTPPVGGPHFAAWLTCDVYTEPVPAVNAVHSMEHGGVWITYRPDLATTEVDALQRLAATKPRQVLVSPYPGLTDAVVASAWGLQLRVTSASDPRLTQFVQRYAGGNQGSEGRVGCASGLSPAQARQYDERASGHTPPS